MSETTDIPVWGHELQYWLNLGTTEEPSMVQATELLSWEVSGDSTTYTPSWIDRKNQPTFTLGKSTSITWEKDTLAGGLLDKFVMDNRNKTDVPVEIIAVYTWTGEKESRIADKATFLFTPNALKNSSVGQPVVSGGTCSMESDGWTEGTWSETENKFTAVGEPETPETPGGEDEG